MKKSRLNSLDNSKAIEACRPISPKKTLKRLYKEKQWLLDNQDDVMTKLNCYDNFYMALGQLEMRILETEAEIRRSKRKDNT